MAGPTRPRQEGHDPAFDDVDSEGSMHDAQVLLREHIERMACEYSDETFDQQEVIGELEGILGPADAAMLLKILTPRHCHMLRRHAGGAYSMTIRGMVDSFKQRKIRIPLPVDALFESIPVDQRLQLLFQALLHARMDPREEYRKNRELEHHKHLLRTLLDFVEAFLRHRDVEEDIQPALMNLQTLFHPGKLRMRRRAMEKNYHTAVLDSTIQGFHDELQQYRSFVKIMKDFYREGRAVLHVAETSAHEMEHAAAVEDRALGFRAILEQARKMMNDFPKRCRELLESLRSYHEEIANQYCRDRRGDRRGPRFAPADMPIDPEGKVPLFRGNLHYTAFLHGLVEQIPAASYRSDVRTDASLRRKKKKRSGDDLEYDRGRAMTFVDFLRHHADVPLISNVNNPRFFKALGSLIKDLHVMYAMFEEAYERSNLEQVDASGPSGARQDYALRMKRMLDRTALSKEEGVRLFDPSDVIRAFDTMNMQTPPSDGDAETGPGFEGRDAKTEEQRAMIALFTALDEKLVKVAEGKEELKGPDGLLFVEELMRRKMETRKKRRRKLNRLRRDRMEDNYTYRVEGGGPFADLSLYQVPTEPGSWNDMVGSSWKDIQKQVDVIYRMAERSHIYSDLAPRSQIKSNLLLVGPPGSGKNMGIRALMADKRTVGIATRVDELMSEFVGRGQKNVGQLIDAAYDLRLKHDRPAVIAIDEIDELFAKDSHGVVDEVKRSMQKALQSVLDGHFQRDGVVLVGLTNNPEYIPATIFRRFAHVNVVEALTPPERRELLQKLLAGVPKQEKFDEIVNWDEILERSQFASGDVLGKIADRTYLKFIELFDKSRPGRLDRINERLAAMKDAGKTIDAATKVRLLTEGTWKGKAKGMGVLDATMFERIALSTLEDDAIQEDMVAQEAFYDTVYRKIAEGIKGKRLE